MVHDASRRRFLHAGALAGAGVALAACGPGNVANNAPVAGNAPVDPTPVLPARKGVLVGGGSAPPATFVGVVNLDAQEIKADPIHEIGFVGHGFTPRIDKPHIVLVTEKHGPGCIELDLNERKILRRVSTLDTREFYGHSAFSPDGKLWYCTEAVVGDGSYNGVLAVRDAHSFELRPENFPTHGIAPHDCILIDDGETLVVTNGGGASTDADNPASVAYVNVKTGEARRVLKFKNERINAGHIAISSKGELICVSAPRDDIAKDSPHWRGAISFYYPDKDEFVTADDPIREKMLKETLSVAFHEPSRIVAATNPEGNIITFWDFDTAKLVKSITDLKVPRGVALTLDQKYFVVTHDRETKVSLISTENLMLLAPSVDTSFISGSHAFVFDL